MASVKQGKQLLAITENKVGMLAEVASEVSSSGVNIQGISAYAIENKAYFRILTENNQAAKKALEAKGYEVVEEDVIIMTLANKVGALKEVADKLKAAGLDLKYIYGTTCSGNCDCILVFSSNDNAKAEQVLEG